MLLDELEKYASSGTLPMHMPGHKRNFSAFPWLSSLGGALDITEIYGFDDLNCPEGVFASLEQRMAALRGADETVCLVNGSTAAVLAAVTSVLPSGGGLLMCRGSHRSLYNAAELCRANVYYLTPPTERSFGITGSVEPDEVKRMLDLRPNIALVAVTSPTYDGVISDIGAISKICRSHGVPLFVDEAHGAHLGIGGFPESAVTLGADLVAESLHKTLPALTQTACLHINHGLVDPYEVRRRAAMFQSSSPSYILSASLDACVSYLETEGERAARRWLEAVSSFEETAAGFSHLRLFTGGDGVFARDPSKLLISTAGTDMTGVSLMRVLREKYSIELETANAKTALAMTGMGDTEETVACLARAISEIDGDCRTAPDCGSPAPEVRLPERRLPAHEALSLPSEAFPVSDSVRRVSAEYVWAYPPGIPILVPGEVIDEGTVRTIMSDMSLHSTKKRLPHEIFCVSAF